MNRFLPFICLFFLASCVDKAGTGKRGKHSGEILFPDYQVWGEEGKDDVTVRLQFHPGDEEGAAVVLNSPGKVMLDDEELTADSARLSGAYYEVSRPLVSFKGKHTVVFIDEKGKEHRNEFTFEPFTLLKELPETVKTKPFRLQLQDFPKTATPIRLVMVDTSLQSTDVNEELTIEDGELEITEDFLANLTPGPVTMEIYREEEHSVGSEAVEGGKITLTFALKRQFTLVE